MKASASVGMGTCTGKMTAKSEEIAVSLSWLRGHLEGGTRTGQEEEDDGEDGLPCPDGLCVLRAALQC